MAPHPHGSGPSPCGTDFSHLEGPAPSRPGGRAPARRGWRLSSRGPSLRRCFQAKDSPPGPGAAACGAGPRATRPLMPGACLRALAAPARGHPAPGTRGSPASQSSQGPVIPARMTTSPTHMPTHAHTQKCTQRCAHTHTCMHTHVHTYMDTYARTNAHSLYITCSHVHTHST